MANTSLTLVFPGLATILQQKINANILPQSLKKIITTARFEVDNSNLSCLLFNYFSETPIDTSITDQIYASKYP